MVHAAGMRGLRALPRGFAVMVALFILVTLAGLATVVVTISTGQQRGFAFDVQGTKAYQAARAGVEYGLRLALINPVAATCASNEANFALSGNFAGYAVRIDCATNTFDEAGVSVKQYEITATGCNRASCPGTADATYVERQLRVSSATNPP